MPEGIAREILAENVLEVDELEAIRLLDLEGLYQEEASEKMSISRATLSNIIHSAHLKVARSLIRGEAIRINCPLLAEKKIKGNKNSPDF